MAGVIREFNYSKTTGRGRGILGLKEFNSCRKPGNASVVEGGLKKISTRLVIALFKFDAKKDSPGGFHELSVQKGQILELLGEHSSNEHWWEVRNEDGDVGYVPSSYVIIKDEQALPWLQEVSLKSEEEERKIRVKRLLQQKSFIEGTGFGPAPKDRPSTLPSKQYNTSSNNFYCEVCDKKLNGPKPFQAHMASKGHKEELALLESSN